MLEKSGTQSKSRGRPTYFYCGKPGHFRKNCRHYRKDNGADDTDSKKSSERNGAYRGATDRNGSDRRGQDRKGTTALAASEEEIMLITEEGELNIAGDETTWVVDSGASFHLTPERRYFSSYTAGEHGCVRMGWSDVGDECRQARLRFRNRMMKTPASEPDDEYLARAGW